MGNFIMGVHKVTTTGKPGSKNKPDKGIWLASILRRSKNIFSCIIFPAARKRAIAGLRILLYHQSFLSAARFARCLMRKLTGFLLRHKPAVPKPIIKRARQTFWVCLALHFSGSPSPSVPIDTGRHFFCRCMKYGCALPGFLPYRQKASVLHCLFRT